jgi:uncharacterized protein (DUF697 family)
MSEASISVGRDVDAMRIVNKYVGWSTGAGLIPLPLVDLAAIAGVQLKMVQELTEFYDVPFSRSAAKSIIGAVIGSGGAYILAAPVGSLLKVVPFIGTIAGMLAEPALAAASTYALGKVFIQHFESGGTFLDLNPGAVRRYYNEEYESARKPPAAGKAA